MLELVGLSMLLCDGGHANGLGGSGMTMLVARAMEMGVIAAADWLAVYHWAGDWYQKDGGRVRWRSRGKREIVIGLVSAMAGRRSWRSR
jgi:hypothetical protein